MSNKIEMMFAPRKRIFECTKQDIEDARIFVLKNKWGADGCPFYLEWPYLTIPDMLKSKLTKYYLNIKTD